MTYLFHDRPPGYRSFFALLQRDLNLSDLKSIRLAYFASEIGHAGEVRDSGEGYFDHPKAAAWIYINELGGRDPRQIITILLHDLFESTCLLFPYRIGFNFGKDIESDVRSLTKLPKGEEITEAYLGRIIKQGEWAIMAKLCDRLHNLRTLGACTKEKQQAQIIETETYHVKLLIPALRAVGSLCWEYADSLEEKIVSAVEHAGER